LRGIITDYEHDKLKGLSRDKPFPCRYSPDLIDELRHLRAMNLVQNREGVGLRTITEHYRDVEFDLRDIFFITDDGHEYLRLLRELEALDD
jgi:hypothetical protein